MTIFFVTHDLEEAAYLGTRIFVLSRFYSDDRHQDDKQRGAKIVADHHLPRVASASDIKIQAEFVELLDQIRRAGFDPEVLQHAREFNLQHPDAFQTLTAAEARSQK